MKDLTIFIPTRGRIDKQVTLASLPKELLDRVVLVAPKEEVKALRQLHSNVVAQPSSVINIAQKRAWIIKHLCDTDKLLMMDDDLYWNSRQVTDANGKEQFVKEFFDDERGKTRLLLANPKHVVAAVKEFSKYLDKYAHAGFGSRMGNSRIPEATRTTTRMMHALGYVTNIAKKEIVFNRINQKEDFDYTLQLLRKGFNNIVIHHTFVETKGYGMAGGCKEEREAVGHDDSAYRLAELHPEFVSVVERNYKTGIPRKEVVVQWKKAYESHRSGGVR